eukprot:jgi/Botrbrau1/10621/Bobra.154_1s0011.1
MSTFYPSIPVCGVTSGATTPRSQNWSRTSNAQAGLVRLGRPCLDHMGQPSGRDLMRLQSLVDVVTNLVAGGATFAACSRPPSGPEQEQDTAPFAASSPESHARGAGRGGWGRGMPAWSSPRPRGGEAVVSACSSPVRRWVWDADTRLSCDSLFPTDEQLRQVLEQQNIGGGQTTGDVDQATYMEIRDAASAAFAEFMQQMVRPEQAAALAQLWTCLAAFLDRTMACLAASCQEVTHERQNTSLVEVKLEALRAKYEATKGRVCELEGRGRSATEQTYKTAAKTASAMATEPDHVARGVHHVHHQPAPAAAATEASLAQRRSSRTSSGAPAPAPWPLHPAVAASLSSSFQVFENPGYSPSSSGGGCSSQRRRSSSGALPVPSIPLPAPLSSDARGEPNQQSHPARTGLSGDDSEYVSARTGVTEDTSPDRSFPQRDHPSVGIPQSLKASTASVLSPDPMLRPRAPDTSPTPEDPTCPPPRPRGPTHTSPAPSQPLADSMRYPPIHGAAAHPSPSSPGALGPMHSPGAGMPSPTGLLGRQRMGPTLRSATCMPAWPRTTQTHVGAPQVASPPTPPPGGPPAGHGGCPSAAPSGQTFSPSRQAVRRFLHSTSARRPARGRRAPHPRLPRAASLGALI